MATQWYYRSTDGDQGPVAFLRLAELLNDGVLDPQSLVKEERSSKWRRVEEVEGLLPQAKRLRDAPLPPPPAEEITTRKPQRHIPDLDRPPVQRTPWGAYIGLVVITAFIATEIWWFWPRTPKPFPDSQPVTLKFETPSRILQMVPRSPKDPKQLLKPSGPAVRIPGLENVAWAKNPVLTPDLRTIVYVSWGGDQTVDDLFIAERTWADKPFEPPQKIANCASPKRETFPTLTADGLQLVYSEETGPARLMIAKRTERGKPFDAPQQLVIEKLDPALVNLDQPQFLNGDDLHFTATNGDVSKRAHFLARRKPGGTSYVVAAPLGFADPWKRYYIIANRRRAYFLIPDGLCVTMQPPRTSQFTTPEQWLTSEPFGPELTKFDDSLWMAPSEDTIVFCTQGHDQPDSRDRYLWMLRLE